MLTFQFANLFSCLLVGSCLHVNIGLPTAQKSGSKSVKNERPSITWPQGHEALANLVKDKAFLSEPAFLEPLRTQIKQEIENSFVRGFPLSWSFDLPKHEFSYLAKSADRTELHTVRGWFVLGDDKKWVARISEASRTKLVNRFDKKEFGSIEPKMTLDQVIRAMGCPPGAYYSGDARFDFHDGFRSMQFAGSAEQCQKILPVFFARTAEPQKTVEDPRSGKTIVITIPPPNTRAWISNDTVFWVTFDENGRVVSKESTKVRLRNEIDEATEKMLKELRK